MKPYLLYPSVYEKNVSFVAQDDLYVMDLESGNVRRLVHNMGVVCENRFSPDGKGIYFRLLNGSEVPVSEVFYVDLKSGMIKQCTNFGSQTTSIAGFTSDGMLIASSNIEAYNRGYTELFLIDGERNYSNLSMGPATDILFHGNITILGRNTRELPHWKQYQGGTHGVIWADTSTPGNFRKIVDNGYNINSIFLMGQRIYFISDHEGSGAIYSTDTDGGNLKRHTDPDDFYARHAYGHNGKIVFSKGADIYLMESPDSKPVMLEVPLTIDQDRLGWVSHDPLAYSSDLGLDSTGENLNLIARGQGKILNIIRGPVHTIDAGAGRIKHMVHIKDQNYGAVHDEDGEDAIAIFSSAGERIQSFDIRCGIIYEVSPSPDGKSIAFSNNRYELHLLDVEKGKTEILSRAIDGKICDLKWHHSSRYLAYTYSTTPSSSQIRIYDVREKKEFPVTSQGYKDSNPVFDPTGHFLAYISQRELDPVYDKVAFQLSYPMASRPYLVTLTGDVKSPFTDSMHPEDEKIDTIDFTGIEHRSVPFPMDIADYTEIAFADSTLLSLKFPVEGSMKYYLFSRKEKASGVLEAYDLRENRLKTVASSISGFAVSSNGEKIAIAGSENLVVAKSSARDIDLSNSDSDDFSKIDLERIVVSTSRKKEFRQMFRETWVLMREFYWNREKIENIWEKVYIKYEPLLERVGSRYALSDLLRNMMGELGTSHCYEMGAEITETESEPIARLAADFSPSPEGIRLKSIHEGDPTSSDEKSPLRVPGYSIREGDILVSVDSRPVKNLFDLFDSLKGMDDKTLMLRFSRDGREFSVPVKPLRDDRHIRYRSWVEKNRKYVHEMSKNEVGYIHIPDMGPSGFNEFFRLLESETRYSSLIVDVRFNGGGHVSELLLEKLNRRRLGFDQPRYGNRVPYPSYSVSGRIVALTNEYAGSDGDIFSHSFKLMGLGKLIGKRTWGGVVGINPDFNLVDNTEVTQPQFAFSFKDVGFAVENYGTDPDLDVDYPPHEYLSGKDPQLDRAIEETLSG